MRIHTMSVAVALALIARTAAAQGASPAQPAAPPAPMVQPLGELDLGVRVTDAEADEARYERYRDLRSGAASRFRFGKQTDQYVFDASAFNIGYRDQQYRVGFDRDKLQTSFLWDSIPTNYSYLSYSAWTVDDAGVLTIDPALRRQVEARTAVGVPCAPGAPPAACSNPTTATQALTNRSIYVNTAAPFDLQQRRDIAAVALKYNATPHLGLNINVSSTKKGGHQPWGAAFAFNDANEVPLPIDNRTNDLEAGIEWANPKGMVRFAWNGSFFNNDVPSLTWDNPIRATDFNNGLLPPAGPYDPNGYSNGNTAATGRMALWPDNSQHVLSGTALYKLPAHTSVNGTLQLTQQSNDTALIPWTTNSVITSPSVLAAFPHLAHLPRETAEAEVRGINALLNLNSRPARNLTVSARYRYNDRDNRTPPFDATEYVRFDSVPEELEEGISHQFDVTRQTFDANASYSFGSAGALRAGYTRDQFERHGRGFSDVGEDIFRVSFDTISNQYISLRAGFEHGQRRGSGYIESDIDDEGPGGTQPGLRYYDEADRDRDRGLLTVTVMPTSGVDLTVSYGEGKENFDLEAGRFGLLSADTRSVAFGIDASPRETVAIGATYGWEEYSAFQKSRNANPAPDPSWFDPTRDWNIDHSETVNTAGIYLDLIKALPKTDIHVAFDLMDSTNAFLFGGPRINQLNTNTFVTGSAPCAAGVTDCFEPLPDVETRWTRLSADVRYFFAAKVGVGFGLLYEDQQRLDFATIDGNGSVGFTTPTDTARIDYLGGLVTGYSPRPYRGVTTFVRLLYQF
ncbi:MAG TPA: MtrB/PioB family outer membrane beta-barrel protein [Vicinamibacterales bacterium]